MSKTKRKHTIFRTRNHEEGVALIAAILTLLLLSAITAGIIILTNTETNTSSNFKDEQRAFFSAKAGIEEVRDRLRTAATGTLATSTILPTTLPGSGTTGVTYVLNPLNSETVAPWTAPTTSSPNSYVDDEICKETSTVSCSGGYPSSSGWVYVLTALSVTPGGSRRMLQVEVGQDTFQFNAPAALTLDGPGDTFSTGPSSKFGVNGNDSNTVCGGSVGPNVPSVGVPDDADKTATITQIDNAVNGNTSKEGNYQSGSNTTPDVQNVYTGLPSTMQTKTSLTDLMSTIKADVTQPVINGPATDSSFTSPGTLGYPQIIYVNGDLTLSGNFTGFGILVVTGTFTAKGSNTWNGLIFVVGAGNFIDKGTSTFNGAVVVANTTGTGTTLGAPNVDVSGGGNGGVNYSSGCIVNATQLTTYHVISMRELLN